MEAIVSKKPLISSGWLRVLIFVVVYIILLLSAATIAGLIIAMGGKNISKDDINKLMNTDFLWLTVLSSLIISLIVVFVFRKFIDRKSFVSLGFETEGYMPDAVSGLFLAPVILGLGSLMLFSSGHLKWVDIDFNATNLFISLGIFIMVAISEEIVFRGYILNNLLTSFNKWIALGISALLFMLAHLGSDSIGFLPLLNIFLAGILLGINYVYTKNLWFAMLLHFSWNFLQGPILGFKVSGLTIQTLLQTELKGDILLTGGDFGFEGSFIDTLITIAAILIIYLIYEKKHKEVVSMKYEL
jgi:membrane protease YdiL (CAAX protease family)